VLIPAALLHGTGTRWPLVNQMPPLSALLTAPASARVHVSVVLNGWRLGDMVDDCQEVVSEMVTNAVQASTAPAGGPIYVDGHMAIVTLRLLSNRRRVVAEVWDEAPGFPAPRRRGR
jgi:anti-sigma regulatory factor (Ser/Thr protein kinase)